MHITVFNSKVEMFMVQNCSNRESQEDVQFRLLSFSFSLFKRFGTVSNSTIKAGPFVSFPNHLEVKLTDVPFNIHSAMEVVSLELLTGSGFFGVQFHWGALGQNAEKSSF